MPQSTAGEMPGFLAVSETKSYWINLQSAIAVCVGGIIAAEYVEKVCTAETRVLAIL